MIPGLHEFFANLNYTVSIHNPMALGLLFLMGIMTDIGIPLFLTLEIFLLFASYYVGPISPQVLLIVIMLLAGRETGAAILYWISRLLGDPFLHWLQRHIPWMLGRLNRLKSRVKRRTTLAVVLVRLTPGFLQIPSLVAGSLHLQYSRFAIGVAFSSLIYDFGLVLFGFIAREVLPKSDKNLQDYFILGFVGLIIIMWLVLFLRFRHFFDVQDGEDK